MVLWSRLRLVGVCSDLFPLNKIKFKLLFNQTRQPAGLLLSFQIIGSMFCVFVLISGSKSSDGLLLFVA
jgi:hypothetical protein